jgi:hypothetical protein
MMIVDEILKRSTNTWKNTSEGERKIARGLASRIAPPSPLDTSRMLTPQASMLAKPVVNC